MQMHAGASSKRPVQETKIVRTAVEFHLNQGCPTRGPQAKSGSGAEVLWSDERFRLLIQGYCRSFVGGQRVLSPQSLTLATATRGPMWLYPFDPAVLHGCTSLPKGILDTLPDDSASVEA